MLARTIRTARMADIPVGWRMRIRELSLGPVEWGAWSWTFQNGSCWAAMGFADEVMVGWAMLTEEVDRLPVIGVYVTESHRGDGLGTELLTVLLRGLLKAGDISEGDSIFASSWRWGRYEDVLEELGLVCVPWA